MSDLITIEGNIRTSTGKSYCRKLRQKGLIPANILDKNNPTMIELNPKFLSVAWQSGKKFKLKLDGQEKVVSIKELQLESVRRVPLHVDLMYA